MSNVAITCALSTVYIAQQSERRGDNLQLSLRLLELKTETCPVAPALPPHRASGDDLQLSLRLLELKTQTCPVPPRASAGEITYRQALRSRNPKCAQRHQSEVTRNEVDHCWRVHALHCMDCLPCYGSIALHFEQVNRVEEPAKRTDCQRSRHTVPQNCENVITICHIHRSVSKSSEHVCMETNAQVGVPLKVMLVVIIMMKTEGGENEEVAFFRTPFLLHTHKTNINTHIKQPVQPHTHTHTKPTHITHTHHTTTTITQTHT